MSLCDGVSNWLHIKIVFLQILVFVLPAIVHYVLTAVDVFAIFCILLVLFAVYIAPAFPLQYQVVSIFVQA